MSDRVWEFYTNCKTYSSCNHTALIFFYLAYSFLVLPGLGQSGIEFDLLLWFTENIGWD